MLYALYTMAAITSQDITMYRYVGSRQQFSFPDCQTEFNSSLSPHMVDLVGGALPQHPPLLPPPKTINAVLGDILPHRLLISGNQNFLEGHTSTLHSFPACCGLIFLAVSLFGRNLVDKSVIYLTWIHVTVHVVMASSHFRLIMIDNNLFGNYPKNSV